MRRPVQALLAISLCVMIAGYLGMWYVVLAAVAGIISFVSGVSILLAVGLGFVWPILAAAYAVWRTNELRRAAEAAASSPASRRRPTEPDGTGIEDP